MLKGDSEEADSSSDVSSEEESSQMETPIQQLQSDESKTSGEQDDKKITMTPTQSGFSLPVSIPLSCLTPLLLSRLRRTPTGLIPGSKLATSDTEDADSTVAQSNGSSLGQETTSGESSARTSECSDGDSD